MESILFYEFFGPFSVHFRSIFGSFSVRSRSIFGSLWFHDCSVLLAEPWRQVKHGRVPGRNKVRSRHFTSLILLRWNSLSDETGRDFFFLGREPEEAAAEELRIMHTSAAALGTYRMIFSRPRCFLSPPPLSPPQLFSRNIPLPLLNGGDRIHARTARIKKLMCFFSTNFTGCKKQKMVKKCGNLTIL